MRVRFLADANLDQDIVAGVLRREPAVDFELPQGIIPERMTDPDVLAVASSLGRILVTHDVRTMPQHFGEFIARRRSPGLILIPRSMPIGQAIDETLLIWHASEAEEWTDVWRRLPPDAGSAMLSMGRFVADAALGLIKHRPRHTQRVSERADA